MTPALWLISKWWDGWYRLQVLVRGPDKPSLSGVRILACSVAGARAFLPVGVVPAPRPSGYVGLIEAWAPAAAQTEAA